MTDRPVVIVSNRGPLTFSETADGGLRARRGAGGLVSGLLPLVSGTDTVWIAAAIGEGDRRAAAAGGVVDAEGLRVRLLAPDADDFRAAYDVVANATLWFCHHGLFDLARRPRFDRTWRQAWASYRRVNEAFADAVVTTAPRGAVVLVQDYHLALMGSALARSRPDLSAVHFSHTPFAGPEQLAVLPRDVRRELLSGMAGYAACGFHTRRWARAFRRSCEDWGDSVPPTFVAPLGPDPRDLATTVQSPACQAATAELAERVGDRQLVVRVDRVELSKNLVRGFLAFDEMLDRWPEHRGRVVFEACVYPSREGLAEYLAYRAEVEAAARRINERWATADWDPVHLDISDNYPASVAALRRSDVLLVNPVRDGMNLVAKEGPLVNEVDGVLALSTEAGAFAELAEAALAVDPCDVSGTAEVLHAALGMAPEERQARSRQLRDLAGARTPAGWLADQVAAARGLQSDGKD